MKRSPSILLIATLFLVLYGPPARTATVSRNKPERLEWFRDAGFGMFIHWSVDGPLGSTISHSLVGASDDYVVRFYQTLSGTFQPKRFDPRDWAVLARLAGMKYVVFTTKHHAGFCMFRTATTPFNSLNTPFGRDVFAEVVKAFQDQGIAVGVYYSPDDFHFLNEHGIRISRSGREVTPQGNPELMKYDLAQLRELMTNYGRIDVVFLDGPAEGLRDLCWDLQPDAVVTRGAIETPEQYIPGVPLEGAWESCITMGTQWPWKPTNEEYKSGSELIQTLIETRAKGGNLLLNVGPKPDGELPIEQESRLREVALWNFVNGEAIAGVRPWVVTNEKDVWFTRKKNEDVVYAFLPNNGWKLGTRRTFLLRSVRSTPQSVVSVLGQSGEVLEYVPDARPETRWKQTPEGLELSVVRAQRLYDDRKWPNPVVAKITQAQPGLTPPRVTTLSARYDAATRTATLEGSIDDMGQAREAEAGFQYRPRKGATDLYEKTAPWLEAPLVKRSATGSFTVQVKDLRAGQEYEYRAVVHHPLLTIYGQEKTLAVSP